MAQGFRCLGSVGVGERCRVKGSSKMGWVPESLFWDPKPIRILWKIGECRHGASHGLGVCGFKCLGAVLPANTRKHKIKSASFEYQCDLRRKSSPKYSTSF